MNLTEAYAHCESLARSHYENFPVASRLIPRDKRPFLWSIYAFARSADDFADEGNLPPEERLRLLDGWEKSLERCVHGDADHPVFLALGDTIKRTGIPPQLLSDLLTAFRMDVTRPRYETFQDLLGYCRYSANPVGRLVLHVHDNADPRAATLSDSVCTALQLTNFWQDVAVDWKKGRMYIPLEDCRRFGYHESDIASGRPDQAFRDLLRYQVVRTRQLFEDGRPLLTEADPKLRPELRLVWHGGVSILDKIEGQGYDVLSRRPALSLLDKLRILLRVSMQRMP